MILCESLMICVIILCILQHVISTSQPMELASVKIVTVTVSFPVILLFVSICFVIGMCCRRRFNSGLSTIMSATIAPVCPRFELTLKGLTVPKLTEYNFKYWHLALSHQLGMLGCEEAIQHPLPGDHRNLAAISEILHSVDEVHQYDVMSASSANAAVEHLRELCDSNNERKCWLIKEKIRSMRLSSCDKFEEHVKELATYVSQLKVLGETTSERSHLLSLIDSLTGELSCLKHILFTYKTVHEAVGHIRYFLNEIRRKPANSAYLVKNKKSNKRCYQCRGTGHFASECTSTYVSPVMTVNDGEVGASAVSSNDSMVWLIESETDKNFTSGKSEIDWTNTSDTSVVYLVDRSFSSVYSFGNVNVSSMLNLENARYAPEFNAKVISVNQLTSQGFQVHFCDKQATVCSDDGVFLIGKRIDDLYRYTQPSDSVQYIKNLDCHHIFEDSEEGEIAVLRILNSETDDITSEQNVKFIEEVFPFCEKPELNDDCCCIEVDENRSTVLSEDLLTEIEVRISRSGGEFVSYVLPMSSCGGQQYGGNEPNESGPLRNDNIDDQSEQSSNGNDIGGYSSSSYTDKDKDECTTDSTKGRDGDVGSPCDRSYFTNSVVMSHVVPQPDEVVRPIESVSGKQLQQMREDIPVGQTTAKAAWTPSQVNNCESMSDIELSQTNPKCVISTGEEIFCEGVSYAEEEYFEAVAMHILSDETEDNSDLDTSKELALDSDQELVLGPIYDLIIDSGDSTLQVNSNPDKDFEFDLDSDLEYDSGYIPEVLIDNHGSILKCFSEVDPDSEYEFDLEETENDGDLEISLEHASESKSELGSELDYETDAELNSPDTESDTEPVSDNLVQFGGKKSGMTQIHSLIGTLTGELAHLRDILLTYNSTDEAKGHLLYSASQQRRIDDGPKDNVYFVKKKGGPY